MKLTKKQKNILYGLIMGDAYLQKTGEKNSRLRLEHSEKQKDYIDWKYRELENIFTAKPKKIERVHPLNKKKYVYFRLQSNSSPVLGKLRKQFYKDAKKSIPEDFQDIFKSRLSLAVWYMDDGYYYKRDKSAHIYVPSFPEEEIEKLKEALRRNFDLNAKHYCRPDRRGCQLNFTGCELKKLFKLIKPYIIESLKYKIPLTP